MSGVTLRGFPVESTPDTSAAIASVIKIGLKTMHFWHLGVSGERIFEAKHDVETVEFSISSIAVRLSNGDVITLPQTAQFDCVTLEKKDVKFRSAMPILHNVRNLYSNTRSFAALHMDGTVSTWGDERYGADSSGVQRHLLHVREISHTKFGFAAMAHTNKIMWGGGYGVYLVVRRGRKGIPFE